MQTFFSRFYMQFIEERKKNERIPVAYLFPMIKSLVALNENQKGDGKRGETQAGQRGSRAAALLAGIGLREGGIGRSIGFCGGKTCACLGRPERSDGCPAAGAAAAGHRRRPTCIINKHTPYSQLPFFGYFLKGEFGPFCPSNRSVFAPLKGQLFL